MTYTLPLDEAHNLCMAIQTVECVCVYDGDGDARLSNSMP